MLMEGSGVWGSQWRHWRAAGMACLLYMSVFGGELLAASGSTYSSFSGGDEAVASYTGDTLRMLFTGDVMLGRDVARVIRSCGADALFTPSVDSLFATADVVVANLECPATTLESPVNKRFVFNSDPAVLPVLRRHGITHLNLANNHSIDQGRRGLTDTYRNIIAAGMVPVGYGDNAVEAARPLLIGSVAAHTDVDKADAAEHSCVTETGRDVHHGGLISERDKHKGRPVYVLSSLRVMSENYVSLADRPGVCEASIGALCDTITALRSRSAEAFIVVCLHWGTEHVLHPSAAQRAEAHRLVDVGADAVIGHHSHTAQDVETYRGRPIFYSLGNFIFDLDRPLNSRALVAEITITASSADFRAIAVDIRRWRPEVLSEP